MNYAPPRTKHGIFVLIRRLRAPLIFLIVVYATAVAGFTLIPGVDPDGQTWVMSFLQSFYFVSFLGTTIGLGEIPFPFTDTQRLWATATIYSTVIAWLYAIGALFSVLQDPMFRRLVRENSIERTVRSLRMPFYLVCGYDDAGSRVVRELVDDGMQVVVIDSVAERADTVDIDDLRMFIPALTGDAGDPQTLVLAGLGNPYCIGLLALTGDDDINTKIALTARLLSPGVPVLCSVRDHASHARMAAAGADYMFNPYDTFAERVAFSIRAPSLHVIYESLTTQRGTAMDEPPVLPKGRWVICGFGPFARTLRRQLERLDIPTTIIDTTLDDSCDAGNSLKGDPTDPHVLAQANLDEAAALVAGTAIDIHNLAICLAARSLSKQLFIVARQTQRRNNAVFRASPANLVMLNGYVIAAEVLRVLRAPLLASFLRRARDKDESWAASLLQRMRDTIGSEIVESWTINITTDHSPIVCEALLASAPVAIKFLIKSDGHESLHAIPLLLLRERTFEMTPDVDEPLQLGDRVLFCGSGHARATMRYRFEHKFRSKLLPVVSHDLFATAQ